MTDRMYALSLWRPWPWSFFHADKRIENRTWPCPKWATGVPIAMHAAKRFDRDALRRMREGELGELARAVPATSHPEGVVAIFWFSGSFEYSPQPVAEETHVSFADFGNPVPGDVDYIEPDPWVLGPHCWEVSRVVELPEPIPCRGFQRLWRVPADIDEQLRAAARDA